MLKKLARMILVAIGGLILMSGIAYATDPDIIIVEPGGGGVELRFDQGDGVPPPCVVIVLLGGPPILSGGC